MRAGKCNYNYYWQHFWTLLNMDLRQRRPSYAYKSSFWPLAGIMVMIIDATTQRGAAGPRTALLAVRSSRRMCSSQLLRLAHPNRWRCVCGSTRCERAVDARVAQPVPAVVRGALRARLASMRCVACGVAWRRMRQCGAAWCARPPRLVAPPLS